MAAAVVENVLEQVKSWPAEERIELVTELNRLTAGERWDAIGRRVHQRSLRHPLTDEEIDEAVREVRRERPLHLRSST